MGRKHYVKIKKFLMIQYRVSALTNYQNIILEPL